MIIVSQDRNIIINFNNVANVNIEKCYNESLNKEDFSYDILVYIVSSGLTRIAKYQTKERAKEVLEEIIKEYLYCNEQDCMNNIGYVQNRIYEMPKEWLDDKNNR